MNLKMVQELQNFLKNIKLVQIPLTAGKKEKNGEKKLHQKEMHQKQNWCKR